MVYVGIELKKCHLVPFLGTCIDSVDDEHYDVPRLGTKCMAMRLLGRDKLEELKRYEPSSKNWIDAWSTELSLSNWKSKEEVKKHFPKVENIGDQIFVFKVDCCASYVETIIDFNRLLVFVTSVKGNDNGY